MLEAVDPRDYDVPHLIPVLAQAYLGHGDIERAIALAEQVIEQAPENTHGRMEAFPVLGAALAKQGRRKGATKAFAEAVELARRMPMPYGEAVALEAWGRVEGSVERLQQALEIFRRLGAVRNLERIEQVLAEMGAISSRAT